MSVRTVIYPPDFCRPVWSLRRTQGDPLAFLDDLARAPDDVVPFSLAGRPAFLLKHPDDVEAVLVTHHHKYVKAQGLQRASRLLGNGLLTSEGDQHRQQRAVIQPAFHRQQLERYGDVMVRQAVRFRDRWHHQQTIDIASEASALTLAIVGEALFGADVESLSAEVRRAVKAASDTMDPLVSLLAPARRVRPQRERLTEVIDDLIVRHRSAGAGATNLISLLLEAQENGRDATRDQLRDDLLTILLAGHDTIANGLVWTWIVLAQHADVQAQIEDEVDAVLGARPATAADTPALALTRRVLSESLRLFPPAWVIARTATVDHRLAGVHIPAGAVVLISQYLIHRDSRFFPNPAVFDPDRWLDGRQAERPKMAFIPFGAGPRACIGEGFAWMEGVLLLATVAQRWRLQISDEEGPIRPRPQITLRPPEHVRMTPSARH